MNIDLKNSQILEYVADNNRFEQRINDVGAAREDPSDPQPPSSLSTRFEAVKTFSLFMTYEHAVHLTT